MNSSGQQVPLPGMGTPALPPVDPNQPMGTLAKKKRTARKKAAEFNCSKCKLRDECSPHFTEEKLEIGNKRRESDTERIIMILVPSPYSTTELMDPEARRLLTEWCNKYVTANKIYITPVAKCVSKSDPTKHTVQCCEMFLQAEISRIEPDVILCLGKAASVPFGLKGTATEIFNRVYEVDPIAKRDPDTGSLTGEHTRASKLIVTYAPSKYVEDIKVRSSVEAAIRQAERFSKGGNIEPPGRYYMCESPAEFKMWVDRHLNDPRLNKLVHAFDIETNGREVHPKTEFSLKHPPKLRCVSFAWAKGTALCVPFEEDPEGYYDDLKRFLESTVIKFTGHNVAFDIYFLKLVNNIFCTNLAGDTMLMAGMQNPGKGAYGYGLKPLAAEYTDLGGYETDMKSTPDVIDEYGNIIQSKWEVTSLDVMAPYNCADADATLQIFKIFLQKFTEEDMLIAHWIMTNALYPLAEMEHNGFLVNVNWVNESRKKIESILKKYEDELVQLCGGKSYDWESPKQIEYLLYQEFKYPKPNIMGFQIGGKDDGDEDATTGDAALSIINTPFTQTLRKYRKASILIKTFFGRTEDYLEQKRRGKYDPEAKGFEGKRTKEMTKKFSGYFLNTAMDNHLRANFNLTGTSTGRLSSSGDANMQNIPAGMPHTAPGYEDLHEFKVKKAFIARPGWVICNADQSQLELRIAGGISGEPGFIKSYKNLIDMHSRNAYVSFGMNLDKSEWEAEALSKGLQRGTEEFDVYVERLMTKFIKKNYPDERQAAKTVSFGILYGMSKWGLAQNLNEKSRDSGSNKIWYPEECDSLIKKFKSGYPVLAEWQRDMVKFAKKHGYITTYFGRKRYLPAINDKNDFKNRNRAERQAINTPVQSAGSDFMMLGVINMYKRLDLTKVKFLATVHDSVVCEVREDYIDEFAKISSECLSHPYLGNKEVPLTNIIPFVAEFEFGPSYGETQGYTMPN